jgi:hypothetical protein
MDKGYWISPTGKSRLIVEHLQAVRSDPAEFGLTAEEVRPRADRNTGRTQAARRHVQFRRRVLTKAMKNGWIRVRRHSEDRPGLTTFEGWVLDASFIRRVRRFLRETNYWATDGIVISIVSTATRLCIKAGDAMSGKRLETLCAGASLRGACCP